MHLLLGGQRGLQWDCPCEPPAPHCVQQQCNQRLTGFLLLLPCFCSFSLQVPVSPVARISQVSFLRSRVWGPLWLLCVSSTSLTHRLPPSLSSSLPFPLFSLPSHCPVFSLSTLLSPHLAPFFPPCFPSCHSVCLCLSPPVSVRPLSRLSPTPLRSQSDPFPVSVRPLSHLSPTPLLSPCLPFPTSPSSPLLLPPSSSTSLPCTS